MYLSAERLALANQTVKETFEQSSAAWQNIPHWDTGDPSQTQVPNDNLKTPNFLTLTPLPEDFQVMLADVIAPKPDALLANVIAHTVKLAKAVDDAVFPALRTGAPEAKIVKPGTTPEILNGLIDARALVEQGGYRAPSSLITDTKGLKDLSALVSGYPGTNVLLPPANINSLQRVDALETPPAKALAYLLGRRQRIAPAGAADASAGEEPLDLAVSVPPSLEVVGGAANNMIQFRVRITYVLRIKDPSGYAVILRP
ncbi:hypothetical protein BST11_00670 [Mycobacterium alsense]|uniref:Uncharacterized protein n=1 Tax=Mycobacterium alsense TaxID=324058 RepID=A0AA41XNQ3_9MYCO|nr:hypothetical protein [Mycobacterium alsense]MCV7378707.1 hypothetical protein [Mycobacterium alsense]OQZ93855.1 hypothetical protein BST11_00670 [Mycobacterium alsense]